MKIICRIRKRDFKALILVEKSDVKQKSRTIRRLLIDICDVVFSSHRQMMLLCAQE